MTFLRRKIIPVLFLFILGLTVSGWYGYWRVKSDYLSNRLKKIESDGGAINLGNADLDLEKLLSKSGKTNVEKFCSTRPDALEAPAVLSTPPWIKLSENDMNTLMALAGSGEIGKELAELLPVYNSLEDQHEHEDKWLKKNTIPQFMPFVYSGYMRREGTIEALIEDVSAGTSYFRREGDPLGLYTVMEVKDESLVLYNEESGARVRLLRTPDEFSSKK